MDKATVAYFFRYLKASWTSPAEVESDLEKKESKRFTSPRDTSLRQIRSPIGLEPGDHCFDKHEADSKDVCWTETCKSCGGLAQITSLFISLQFYDRNP